jgi:hypothetical protein
MLMDNGASAQQNNNYYYRNSMPVNRYSRPMQSNSITSRSNSNTQQYKPNNNPWAAYNNIHSNVARSNNNNNNNWGWPTVRPQQQQRWKLDLDDSIEDHSIESSFYRRPSVPRPQRHSINNNPHITNNNNNVNRVVAWTQPAVTARPVMQPIRWNNHFDDSVEDHSVESREFRRW